MASGSDPKPGESKRDYFTRMTAARKRKPKQGGFKAGTQPGYLGTVE